MLRFLLALLLLPVVTLAQNDTICPDLAKDLDGDLQIGTGDILDLLSSYGNYLDIDNDGIPDCQDNCIGSYDACGICNGTGPEILVIDTIISIFDSVYVEAIEDWVPYVLGADTLYELVCQTEYNSCGDPLSFHGYAYQTVEIGEQCWFAENLRSTQFLNGDPIPLATSSSDQTGIWYGLYGFTEFTEGFRCTNSSSFNACEPNGAAADVFGNLYGGQTSIDPRGLCPSGWHVSRDEDWNELLNLLYDDGVGDPSAALRSSSYWFNGFQGIDSYGFNALPAGTGHFNDYEGAGAYTYFAYVCDGGVTQGQVYMSFAWPELTGICTPGGTGGISVRCVKDEN